MSSEVVIHSQGLTKRYVIFEQQRNRNLREVIINALHTPFHRKRPSPAIYALKDVSFEVRKGQAVGIIGPNGAGKSTLLKILSRITEPTQGFVDLRGRVGSLLEVGTGFHTELSGRENIYLNAAILGMKRAEIDRKFDEIVAFAEVEKFIDTPVKRYSSGMQLRLGFAVAAHLEPDILVVDEVLAVGDLEFQRRCLGRMGEIAKGGRTVIFVSHDLGAIRRLCETAIWLDKGRIVLEGNSNEVLRAYENKYLGADRESQCIGERPAADFAQLGFFVRRAEMLNEEGQLANIFRYGETAQLLVHLGGQVSGRYSLEFYLYNETALLVCVGASGHYHNVYFDSSVRKVAIRLGPLTLTSGKYWVSFSVMAGYERIDTWDRALGFDVVECRPFSTMCDIPSHREGVLVLQQNFQAVDEELETG